MTNQTEKYKIIFAGDVAVGKTTAIGSVSDIPPVQTEVKASDAEVIGKTHTTVAFDYGEIFLPYLKNRLRLYGLPGQVRFSFMWEILSKNMLGTILLADHSKHDPIEKTRAFIKNFAPIIQESGSVGVLGVTKSDLVQSGYSIQHYQRMLAEEQLHIPVFQIDAREKNDVLLLIDTLLSQIEAIHI